MGRQFIVKDLIAKSRVPIADDILFRIRRVTVCPAGRSVIVIALLSVQTVWLWERLHSSEEAVRVATSVPDWIWVNVHKRTIPIAVSLDFKDRRYSRLGYR